MRRRPATLEALSRNAPILILGLAAVVSVVVLLSLCSGMTFFQDEWNILLHRRGFNADAFFLPNDVHPIPLVVAIYKILLAIFGGTSVGPERVFSVLLYALTAILLFLYARKRLGDWLALFPAVILLFLGPAWNVLLWPFEISLVGSVTAGLGALLALERNDRAGDALAAVLLLAAVACSSLGIPFALAAGVDVLFKLRSRGWLRLWVPALPFVAYAVWYLAYGHKVGNTFSYDNVIDTPVFVAESIASTLASMTGLTTTAVGNEGAGTPEWGRPLLVALVILSAAWIRRHRLTQQFWVIAAAAFSFWVLAGFDFVPGREPTASRYQYIGVIFVVLLLAEIFRGARVGARVTVALAALTGVVLVSNIGPLRDGHKFMQQQSELARAELAALEISRDNVEPAFVLTPDIAGTTTLIPVDAGSYFAAVEEYGSPAEDPADLATDPETIRKQVDTVLAHAGGVTIGAFEGTGNGPGGAPAPEPEGEFPGVTTRDNCLHIPAGAATGSVLAVLRGDTTIDVGPGGQASVALRRYAEEFTLESPVDPGTALLAIPPDRSEVPWQVSVTGEQAIDLCTR